MGRFFWTTYDHLGRLLAANFCLGVIVIGPLALADFWPALFIPCLIYAFLAWAVLQTAMTSFAMDMRRFRDPALGEFWKAIARFWLAGLKAHLFFLAIGIILFVNLRFWTAPPIWPQPLKWPGLAIAGVCVWCAVFVGLCYLYLLPLLVERKAGIWKAARQAALLALDNPGMTLGAAFVLLAVELLGLAIRVGPLLFCSALLATMSASAYSTALYKYDRLERQAKAQAMGNRKPASWSEILARGGALPRPTEDPAPDLDEDGEPRRSWRELWRPWEM
ncbi:MAG: hypothetical protein NTW86_16050 [Candidatus Sumerlaeota bacterium]|nr:hypothetical protein [Candidatus Sumerlaeota bacterium]